MSLIFSNLVVIKTLSSNHRMYNLYAKFVKILEICKQFSENLVNDSGNVPRRGPVPKFSDLEVVALSLTAENVFERCIGKHQYIVIHAATKTFRPHLQLMRAFLATDIQDFAFRHIQYRLQRERTFSYSRFSAKQYYDQGTSRRQAHGSVPASCISRRGSS